MQTHACECVHVQQYSIQRKRGNEPESPQFAGVYGMSPSENHMTTGRLTCQLRHVKLDHNDFEFYQFTTKLLKQF